MAVRGRSVLFLLASVLLALPARSQSEGSVTITGRVVDDSTGAPLPATHVFVSGSMIGTAAAENGRFRLTGVSSGAKRLYVTHVGYEPEQVDLVLPRDTVLSFTFRLTPTVLEGPPVTVSSERDEDWYDRLDRFKRLFVGEFQRAERCSLLNPEVLRFETTWWGKLEAEAHRPLRFENRALGYRVLYYLKEFEARGDLIRWDGEPIFRPLTPRDSNEAARWAENRRKAFYGSLRHFMLSLLNDRLRQEQFRMYRIPRAQAFRHVGRARRFPVDRDQILTYRPDSLHEISFDGTLEVRYLGAPEREAYLDWGHLQRGPRDYQRSHIRLNQDPIHVDRHGEIVEPYGATLYRYFAFRQRLANLLPREYRPGDPSLAITPSEQ